MLGWPAWLLTRAGLQPYSDLVWFVMNFWTSGLCLLALCLAARLVSIAVLLSAAATPVPVLAVEVVSGDLGELARDAEQLRSLRRSAVEHIPALTALPGLLRMAATVVGMLDASAALASEAHNQLEGKVRPRLRRQ